jgi:hypothetical protein
MENETKVPSITNGFKLVVEAMKLNSLDTIYGVAGIPVTDLARLAQARACATSASASSSQPATRGARE